MKRAELSRADMCVLHLNAARYPWTHRGLYASTEVACCMATAAVRLQFSDVLYLETQIFVVGKLRTVILPAKSSFRRLRITQAFNQITNNKVASSRRFSRQKSLKAHCFADLHIMHWISCNFQSAYRNMRVEKAFFHN